MSDERLTVYACWRKARDEYPDDPDKQKARYVELMREQRHILPGTPRPLPCRWGKNSLIIDQRTPEGQAKLSADLAEMARKRQRAMDGLSDWPMP